MDGESERPQRSQCRRAEQGRPPRGSGPGDLGVWGACCLGGPPSSGQWPQLCVSALQPASR